MVFRGALAGLCGLFLMITCGPAAGQGGSSDEGPKYDPNTVVELLATVVDVQEAQQGGPLSGVHLTVKAGSDTVHAYLGPTAFLKEFEVTFVKGDRVHLVGSKVRWHSSQIVLAREIRKESTTVYLRDKRGTPYWSTT